MCVVQILFNAVDSASIYSPAGFFVIIVLASTLSHEQSTVID